MLSSVEGVPVQTVVIMIVTLGDVSSYGSRSNDVTFIVVVLMVMVVVMPVVVEAVIMVVAVCNCCH